MKVTSKKEIVPAGGTTHFVVQPPMPLRIDNIRLTNDSPELDIEYAQVGNIMLAAFTKRRVICDGQTYIQVHVKSDAKAPLETAVEIEGPSIYELAEKKS